METILIGLVLIGGAIIVIFMVSKWLRGRAEKKEAEALEAATAAREAIRAGVGTSASSNSSRSYRHRYNAPITRQAPQPVVVHEDNTGNMLMAGAVGYMIGSSGSHESHHTPQFDAGGGSSGGAGASGSWDDDRSSGSSSSDSGSSYSSSDSSSSDSGSSSSDSGSSSSSSD